MTLGLDHLRVFVPIDPPELKKCIQDNPTDQNIKNINDHGAIPEPKHKKSSRSDHTAYGDLIGDPM